MNAKGATDVADRELVFTRVFDAPRELVFRAWTDPHRVARWWGPNGFTTTIHEMDVRPGGSWSLTMHGPDGVDFHGESVFVEVKPPERLVYNHGSGKKDEPGQFQATVAFAEQGSQTEVTMRLLFASPEELAYIIREFKADDGGRQTLARLADYLSAEDGMNMEGRPYTYDLVLTRVLDAPRDLVWKAWTDSNMVAQWWGPRMFDNPVCEMDVRPGGAILIHMRGPDGVANPMTGTFHEVRPPERLVFTSRAFEQEDGTAMLENLNTLTFDELEGKTRLTLSVFVLRATPEMEFPLSGQEVGWNQTLDKLEELLAQSSQIVERP